jgi:hypothetical protein
LLTSLSAAFIGPWLPAQAPLEVATDAERESHTRMLRELAEVAARTDAENDYLGSGPAAEARGRLSAALEQGGSAETRFRLLVEVAEHELRMGHEKVAIERYLAARALLGELPDTVPDLERAEAVFQLGVAWMRYGETQNCALRHNADSCILPIRGEGVHVDREGSQQAMRYFREVLSKVPRTQPLFIKTAWMLNLAAMTLGQYPDGVEPHLRIALESFGSDEAFPHFVNVGPRLGIATFNLAGGTVLDDLDGDGDLDLFTSTSDTRGQPRLLLNGGAGEQDGSARFVDVTEQSGLLGLYGGLNVAHADYDNDGDLDLYVLRGAWLGTVGRHPNSLLRNEGGGRFVDVTFSAGLGESHFPTQTAGWADYDNDGDVDLFVGNEWADEPGFDARCQLFRNNGDGSFTDVAGAAGVAARVFAKGVSWGDYNGDRYSDLYVSVLGGPNLLYRNKGDGTFEEVAGTAGVQQPKQSFPAWFWDYDNDGHLDLYVSSYKGDRDGVAFVAASYLGLPGPWELAKLYRGDGRGGFVDVAPQLGLTRLHLPMGSNYGDIDGDGWLDFYLGTGYPDYEALMPNVLYRSQEARRFADVTVPAGLGNLQKGHAVAFGDFDADGDIDVFEQMGGAFPGDRFGDALYENPGFGHRWLMLHLVGVTSNRAAIGARIRAVVEQDGVARDIFRHVTSGGSFGGNPLRQTLGLGRADRLVAVEIYWPTSDTTQRFEGLEMDQSYRITEGAAAPEPVGSAVAALVGEAKRGSRGRGGAAGRPAPGPLRVGPELALHPWRGAPKEPTG